MAGIRGFLLKLEESPGWLIAQGRLDEAASSMAEVARVNQSPIDTDLAWRRQDTNVTKSAAQSHRLSPISSPPGPHATGFLFGARSRLLRVYLVHIILKELFKSPAHLIAIIARFPFW